MRNHRDIQKSRPFRWLQTLGLTVLALSLLACEQIPWGNISKSARYQQFVEGQKLFQQGNFQDAQRLFLDLQSKDPDSRLLMFNLGAVYLRLAQQEKKAEDRQKLFEKAEKLLKGSLDKSSAGLRQKANYNLGLLYAAKKQYEQALYHFSSASHLARKVLKEPDPDAEKNQELLSMLLRQRQREQQKLNKSRVFRFEEKVFTLRASRPINDLLRSITLQGTFTHETTQQRVIVYGYPISQQRWQLRFVPTRTGKWRYDIKTLSRKLPDGSQTQIEKSLHDQGLFQVLPSARPGQLLVATDNLARFAWKKPEEAKPLTKKKKTKDPKKKAPAKPSAKKEKTPQLAKDERLLVWRGLAINGLFAKTLSPKDFERHISLFEALHINGLLLHIDIDQLFSDKGQPQPEAWKRLQERIRTLQKNPLHAWAFVLNLRTKKTYTAQEWPLLLGYLHARLAHVHVVWSLRDLPKALRDASHKWLLANDPYKQPIALPSFSQALQDKLFAMYRPTSKPSQKAQATAKDKKKPAKPPLRYALHTYDRGEPAMLMRPKILSPWLTEQTIQMKLDPKSFLTTWWRRFLGGISLTLELPRPLHADESENIVKWLQKASVQEDLPLHPDQEKAKAKTAQSKATTAQTNKPQGAKTGTSPKAPAARSVATSRPTSKPLKAKTPKDQDLSRPFLHTQIIRMQWEKFLASVRLNEYLRPDPVPVRVPDLKSLAKSPTSKPNKKLAWRTIPLYGYIATNGLTTLYMPPPKREGKPPKIRWKQYKLDLDFTWFNARTGKFLKTQKLRQVTGLELTSPKKEAHIAKVMIADHPINASYAVLLPKDAADLDTAGLYLRGWMLVVQAPKRPKQKFPFLRTARGWEARFRPETPGMWTFHIEKQGKRPQGDLGLPSRLKVMPSALPAPLMQHPKAPRFLVAGQSPFFFYARKEADILARAESLADFKKRVERLRKSDPALTVLVTRLPAIAWPFYPQDPSPTLPTPHGANNAPNKGASPQPSAPLLRLKPSKAPPLPRLRLKKADHGPTPLLRLKSPTSLPALGTIPTSQPTFKTPQAPKAPKAPRLLVISSPELLKQFDMIEAKLKILHEAGFHIALQLDLKRWGALDPMTRMQRTMYLLDRLNNTAPLIWTADLSGKDDVKKKRWVAQMLQTWVMVRLVDPKGLQDYQKDPKKAKKPGLLAPPPLTLAYLGKPRSTARLEEAEKFFAMLWLDVKELERETNDFKLLARKRPVLLTWAPLRQKDWKFPALDTKSGKTPKAYLRWASFLWQAHTLGFHHAGPALPQTFLPASKTPKTADQLALTQRIPLLMRGFFQTFDWTQLKPGVRSLKLREHQAFGAETPAPRQAKQPHHVVVWVRSSVRGKLEFERRADLKKHRYLWFDPLSGQRPIQPQLLPPAPKKGQPETFQVPFRPAVLYLFRRPPQKGGKKRPRPQPQKQQQKQDRVSKRQEVRNRLKRLQEDRRDLLRKMLKQQKPASLSEKRG
ncbi:MAG: DUF5060 domain-containing protein [Myxococcales bacterium]|nr:DUF5060 domain-containing protein [Myxococcales bacterium]